MNDIGLFFLVTCLGFSVAVILMVSMTYLERTLDPKEKRAQRLEALQPSSPERRKPR